MEIPVKKAKKLFIGKTIVKMDTKYCNQIEFLFDDGTKVALHIEIDGPYGLPTVTACTHCAEIT